MIQQQQTYFLELYRAGMRTASDITRASLETTQRMQSEQMEALREALEENMRGARELGEVRSLDQLMALQTRLATEQIQRSADVWNRLWRTASEGQAAMIGQAQAFAGRSTDETARFSSQASGGSAANTERGKDRKSA
jgi:hypothetical protein